MQEDKRINLLRRVLHCMADWCLAFALQVFRHVQLQPQTKRQLELHAAKPATTVPGNDSTRHAVPSSSFW